MDLSELKWTKNINHQHGEKFCAFDANFKTFFPLQWKKEQEKNAGKPNKGELIILRQRCKVTHIVELLDDNPSKSKEPNYPEFSIYREVQVVWMAENGDIAPHQHIVFGYHVNYQGGYVMELETLPTFKKHWDSRGELAGFKNHVLKVLKLEKDSN
jgi:hypothetical protein